MHFLERSTRTVVFLAIISLNQSQSYRIWESFFGNTIRHIRIFTPNKKDALHILLTSTPHLCFLRKKRNTGYCTNGKQKVFMHRPRKHKYFSSAKQKENTSPDFAISPYHPSPHLVKIHTYTCEKCATMAVFWIKHLFLQSTITEFQPFN